MISLSCPQDGYTLRDAEKPETALERAILGALLMHPELTRSALARQVRGRRKDVYAAINNLVACGRIAVTSTPEKETLTYIPS